jgi:hypothetical protein
LKITEQSAVDEESQHNLGDSCVDLGEIILEEKGDVEMQI